ADRGRTGGRTGPVLLLRDAGPSVGSGPRGDLVAYRYGARSAHCRARRLGGREDRSEVGRVAYDLGDRTLGVHVENAERGRSHTKPPVAFDRDVQEKRQEDAD